MVMYGYTITNYNYLNSLLIFKSNKYIFIFLTKAPHIIHLKSESRAIFNDENEINMKVDQETHVSFYLIEELTNFYHECHYVVTVFFKRLANFLL